MKLSTQTATIPSLEQLEDACNACDGVSYHGRYQGRFFFEGYAVVTDDAASLTELFMQLDSMGLKMPMPDHQDNMGFNMLFAWDESTWMPKRYVGHKFRTLN